MDQPDGRITANDVDFAFYEMGEGPLALCLHGFPDTPWTWRHLMPRLAEAGYRAVAPSLRGYAPTSVPADGAQQTGAMAVDACALHEVLGGDGDAVIIGHDWGASATYGAASLEPDRWRAVVTASVPPSAAVGLALLDYQQIKQSFYIWFFQTPLADIAVPSDDLRFIDGLWADWSPQLAAGEYVARAKDALRDPANLAAAIGTYRALFDPSLQPPRYEAAQAATGMSPPQPTLYLHGLADGCLLAPDKDAVLACLPGEGSRVELVPDAGHFLHLEEPDLVNGLILDFLAA